MKSKFTHVRFFFNAGFLIVGVLSTQRSPAGGRLDSLVANAVKGSLVHLEKSVDEVRDTSLFPTYGTEDLAWQLKKSDDWTAGFYPGCLWYAYELSGNKKFVRWAGQWTASLESENPNSNTHDLGFRISCQKCLSR